MNARDQTHCRKSSLYATSSYSSALVVILEERQTTKLACKYGQARQGNKKDLNDTRINKFTITNEQTDKQTEHVRGITLLNEHNQKSGILSWRKHRVQARVRV